jgi:hypothetical protein
MTHTDSLQELLLREMSRRNTDLVADLVFQKPEAFETLFSIFASNQEPVSRRAAWVVDIVSEKHPALIKPHLDELVDLLVVFKHDGLKRHTLRILNRSPLPADDRLGVLMAICFDWLLSPKEAVAAKVYCMELLYRISLAEPDLRKELADTIEWRLNEETPGFRNRGMKLLTKLYREIDNR